MSSPTIKNNENVLIIFESKIPILSSVLTHKRIGLAMKWKTWKQRSIRVDENGVLIYGKKNSKEGEVNLTKAIIEYLPDEVLLSTLKTENLNKFTGITIRCMTSDGYDTYFRCVIDIPQFEALKNAINLSAKETNIGSLGPIRVFTSEQIALHKKNNSGLYRSIMRRTISSAVNQYDGRTRRETILAKRGALKTLPVLFDNDMVHGSWWFVVGSIGFLATSVITLINSYENDSFIGEDDSTLSRDYYRASWWIMVLSAIFCLFGSIAFARALHEDPPLRPMFASYYHIQNDELLGSWLYLLSVLCFIPYSLIFLKEAGFNSYVFAFMVLMAILASFVCFMFVLACYPSEAHVSRSQCFSPVMKFCCCFCCPKKWLEDHFKNDWLAGVWFFLWASTLATLFSFIVFLVAIAKNNNLQMFLTGTGLFEFIAFLIGSAYFVAGSYPDVALAVEDEFLDSTHDDDYDMESTNTNPAHNSFKNPLVKTNWK